MFSPICAVIDDLDKSVYADNVFVKCQKWVCCQISSHVLGFCQDVLPHSSLPVSWLWYPAK